MNYETAMALLAEALDDPYPVTTVADLDLELRTSAAATLWVGERSVVFVRVTDCENGERILEAAPAAGDLEEILTKATTEIEQLARDNGCTQIHIQAGRSGWAKALKPHGYEEAAVLLRKILV